MKRNVNFFMTVTALLLLSAVILTGCMYVIAADNGATKPYDPEQRQETSDGGVTQPGEKNPGNPIVEDAPITQTALQTKFNAYLHKDGKTVTIFSEEQYAELKSIRENDNRIPLTQEEILFLVNDSINLYFTYDEIILTNANWDHVIPLLTNQSGNARVIKTGYKGASAYDTYSEAETAYNKMLTDIYEIIYYRIYMHDAGFETVIHHDHSGQDLIFGRRYDTSPISSSVPVGMYQMLAIDGATFSGIDNEEKLVGEYKTLLEWKRMYEADAIIDYEHYPYLNSAVLCTSILNTVRQPMEYKFYIAGPKDDRARQIYPTTELENMMPHKKNERNLFALMDEFVGTICDVATADIIESKSVYGKLNGNGNGIQYFGVVLVAKDSIKDVDSLISILDDKFEIVECWEQQDSNINSKYLEHQKLNFETDISFDDEYMSICFFNSRHPDSDFLDEAGH